MEWEFAVLDAIQGLHTPVLTKCMEAVTFLGEAGWFWILLSLVLLCTRTYRKCGAAMIIALLFDLVLANLTLKPLVARPRPCWINDTVELLVRVPRDYSFPSGHTMASFAAASALFLTWRRAGVFALLLGLLMGFSRLYFYVHFPTDVLAGILLGIMCGAAGVFLMKKTEKTRLNKFYV